MEYNWKYSEKTEPRGTILFEALSPFLKENEVILDVDCGHSPMAQQILDHGHTVTGFDVEPYVIEQLRNTQPRGAWHVLDDVDAHFQGHTVLLFLGVTTALRDFYSSTYLETAERLLELNNPRVILLESAEAADQDLHDQVCQLLRNTGRYVKMQEGRYDAKLEKASRRHFSAWTLQWDYPFWEKLFMAAEDEDLDGLHERFYSVAKYLGYELNFKPLEVYDPEARQIIQPELINKDRIVKRLILEKPKARTIINVGSWMGTFAFHMAIEGFEVDCVECYRKAVDSTQRAQATLPPELSSRLSFRYGLAEHLEDYPLYDVVVNHCLEHVRDPGHVLRESLRHMKPDGHAYFTPPFKHGCDSPTHLHHFMTEQDLLELLPDGYSANITRVKFQDSDPVLNIFILEVWLDAGQYLY